MPKDFMSLTKNECIATARKIVYNSDELYSDAMVLADNGSYGRAVSCLIVSLEELVKGFVLFLDGNGFGIRKNVPEIKILFNKNHSVRVGIALILFILQDLKKDFLRFINFLNSSFDRALKFQDEQRLERFGKVYAAKKIQYVISETDWFSKLEYLRQSGLYVDYRFSLVKPQNIHKEDFEEVHEKIESLHGLKEIIMNETIDIEYVKRNLPNEEDNFDDMYKFIEFFIKSFSNKGEKPLKSMVQKLQEFSDELMQREI